MHTPRSLQTRVELADLASVPTQIVSPQASKPVMGLTQDALVGSYNWTRSKVPLDAKQTMRMISLTSAYNGWLPKPSMPMGWLAKDILSSVLPKITWIRNANDEDENNRLSIIHGVLTDGVFSKESAGKYISDIIHRIWKDYGPEATRLFMDDMMLMTMMWHQIAGFSIGLLDTTIDQKTQDEIKKLTDQVYIDAGKEIAKLRDGQIEHKYTNITLIEQFEMDMIQMLNKARDQAQGLTYKNLAPDNRISATVTSGSKGEKLNVVQMCGLLGQQTLEGGKRIEAGFKYRTLPHFPKYDMRPESHGFIKNNLTKGLTPVEYFLYAIAGREGVISTAIKTGVTGYQQRKLIKVMEDLYVRYDGSVRNANNFIISHSYGMDGFDGSKLELEHVDYFRLGRESFEKIYKWSDSQLKEALTPKAYTEFTKGEDFGPEFLNEELEQIWKDRTMLREEIFTWMDEPDKIYSPVKFQAVLNWVKYNCHLDAASDKKTDIHPGIVIHKVKALLKDIIGHSGLANQSHNIFMFLLRSYLCSKKLILNYRINAQALDLLLLRIKDLYLDALVSPGEMVGIIAAQSMGEPLTQLTLNAFHSTGTAAGVRKAQIGGVPRLREIFSVTSSANIKTPFLNIYLDHEKLGISSDISEEEAMLRGELLLDKIKHTTLDQLLQKEDGMQIYVDPYESETLIEADKKWLAEVREFEEYEATTPWLIRLRFDSRKIQNITLRDVSLRLKSKISRDVLADVVHNDINSKEVVMRLRINVKTDEPKKELRDIAKKILLTPVKGLIGIAGGVCIAQDRDVTLPNGDRISKTVKEYKDYQFRDKEKTKINPMAREYIIQTEGVNLHDAMALPFVQTYRTMSNDLHEVLDVLGIEAAREVIIAETEAIIGKDVSRRHIATLADVMTAPGILVSIDRYGVSKTDTGVLSKATFEETTKKISEAALFGEEDPMKGVSGNMMFGQFFEGGTNAFQILLDEEMLLDPKNRLYEQEEKRKELRKQARLEIKEEQVDTVQDLDFDFHL